LLRSPACRQAWEALIADLPQPDEKVAEAAKKKTKKPK
jgi:hypothetical protein